MQSIHTAEGARHLWDPAAEASCQESGLHLNQLHWSVAERGGQSSVKAPDSLITALLSRSWNKLLSSR